MQIESLVEDLDRSDQRSAAEKLRSEQVKKEEQDKNPHGQVVDIARPAVEQRPDEAKFVSEYDSKVDKETKGPSGRDRAGSPSAAAAPSKSSGEPNLSGANPSRDRNGATAKKSGMPERLAVREPKRAASARGFDEELPRDQEGDHPLGGTRAPALTPRTQGAGGEDGTPLNGQERPPGDGRPNLVASRAMLERAIGRGVGSMDYLHNLDDGDATALNAKRWKHAPFFNRVKRAVANEWHPDLVYLRHDPSGNIYGVRDRMTVLRIHLGTDGRLAGSTVVQSSGIDFLDDEAVDAFKKAQPFPNPPKELVEGDGKIHFNFAFIFELSGKTSFKVYKY
jgi:TonB family protein